MKKSKKLGIKITGIIYALRKNLSTKEVCDDFIKFVEKKGWYLVGGMEEVDLESGKKFLKFKLHEE